MSKTIFISFLLLASFMSYCQTKIITGVITDNSNTPLEQANVIAVPKTEKKGQLKFAIADNKGRYKLELDTNIKYEITVSYIGFIEEVLVIEPNSKTTMHNFILKSTGEQLKEVIIKHDFQPIVIKKDTMTFDIKAFANGNERKLKEILEKLPGVEVDKKGTVTVQGKKVTKMMVEGKSFFGGGSKLAVENIPADALDKIEVIDHFNEVGFMKQVSDSDDLAMNVKLKEDKKKFVFGDIETGAGVALSDNYLAHVGLFYYAPKLNLSLIADANNIGKSTFTFDDLMRFSGGISSFLSGRKSFTNLYSFANDNHDVVSNKSQFSALNYSFDASSKLSVSGFALFSKVLTDAKTENVNTYLQNNFLSFENNYQNSNSKSILGIGNIKLDYSPNKKEKWYYNAQYQSSTNDFLKTINSITNINNSVFETITKADNTDIKQYIEWHKNFNLHHTTTFVVNQSYENSTPENSWLSDQPFLAGLIPLQTDVNYAIEQVKKIKNSSVDALLKHYWIINNFNHIYFNIGNNFGNSSFITSEKQFLTNGSINNFETAGFENNTKYQLNDAYFGLEYKFKIEKLTTKLGGYLHSYNLKTNQIDADYSLSKTLFQPQFNSEYEFNKSETLNFNYKLVNNFADVSQLSNRFSLQNYNSVFKGNALLENEQYHSAQLRYSKMNSYRGILWNGMLVYNKKLQRIRNEIQLNGINQFNTPVLTNNPETDYRFNGSFGKKIYRFNLRFNTNLGWNNFNQTVNNVITNNNRNNQDFGIEFKTSYRKWPDFSVGYNKGFNEFNGLTNSKFKTDALKVNFENTFYKSWTYKFDYENLKNTNNDSQTNFYEIANTSLRYQKKNSPLGFELIVNNLFDIKTKNDFAFSDYMISEQATFVLPRVIMISLNYKL